MRGRRRGATVIVADLDRAEAEETAAAVEATGGRAAALAGDVSVPAQIADMVAEAIAAFGRIDILVNNAGVTKVPALTLDLEDWEAWDRVMTINVRAVFQCSQLAADYSA